MDQREHQADRDTGEAGDRRSPRGADDDEDEERGEHDLHDDHRRRARSCPASATRSRSTRRLNSVLVVWWCWAAVVAGVDDQPDHEPPTQRTEDLADEVDGHLLAGCAFERPHADGHGRVDVAARDVAEEVRGAQQAEAERDSDPECADETGTDVLAKITVPGPPRIRIIVPMNSATRIRAVLLMEPSLGDDRVAVPATETTGCRVSRGSVIVARIGRPARGSRSAPWVDAGSGRCRNSF